MDTSQAQPGAEPNTIVVPDAKVIRRAKTERSWQEDFGHENGNYNCICYLCDKIFIGYKRRIICKVCAGNQR